MAITNLDDNAIRIFLNAKVVSDAVKEALRNVIKRKSEIEAAVAQRQEHQRQISVIEQEQESIRRNMAELPKDSDLFRRYITKFTDQENEIEDLREKVTQLVAQEQQLRKALDDYLAAAGARVDRALCRLEVPGDPSAQVAALGGPFRALGAIDWAFDPAAGDEPARHLAPVGAELDRRHGEDQQAQPAVPVDALDP